MNREQWRRRPGRSSKWIRRSTRLAIYRRDGFACVWCGALEPLTLDHAVPRVNGGHNRPTNVFTVCSSCNSRRKDRPLVVFARELAPDDWRALVARVRAVRRRKLRR